jgi:hypothetical protein
VLTTDEVEEFFGPGAHKQMQDAGLKSLTKHLLRAAASGKMISPDGVQVNPDDVLVILNDVLDLNDKGWTGKTIETIAEMRGVEPPLREQYDRHVADLTTINTLKALRRQQRDYELQAAVQRRAERVYRLRIFLSRCNVDDKPVPSEEEQQQMLDGIVPIPDNP